MLPIDVIVHIAFMLIQDMETMGFAEVSTRVLTSSFRC